MKTKDKVANPVYDAAENWLTPSKEDQTWLILKGKCPHNQGWNYEGHGHNSSFYRCRLCGELKDY